MSDIVQGERLGERLGERIGAGGIETDIITTALPRRGVSSGRVRLRTLVSLRWLAVIGQLSAVMVVSAGFGFELPLAACLAVIAISAVFNLGLMLFTPLQRIVPQEEAAAQIIFDTLQLSALLYLTGGVENPFSLLLIAAASTAAATLRWQWTVIIICVALFCLGILFIEAQPIPWNPQGGFELPLLYQYGLGSAIIIGLLFTAASSWRLSEGEARMGNALLATQAVLAREQRMAALGSLAAAAAHELGTPLATIQVTAKEMQRNLPEGLDREDASLILSQAERCRVILRNLTAGDTEGDPTMEMVPWGQLLEEAAARHADSAGKAILFDIHGPADAPPLIVRRSPEVLYGLGNFLQNALEFASTRVMVTSDWDRQRVRVSIIDDGPGFDPDVLPRLGEPYVSTRGQDVRNADKHEGLGLGFFIAKTLIERSGGRVTFRNQITPQRGAVVRVEWSRGDLEAA